MKNFQQFINEQKQYSESSLSRLWSHNVKHDCAAITAFRKFSDCNGNNGIIYSKKDNEKRNRSLKAKLKSKEYGLTEILGIYPEGGVSTKEQGFFVVDLKDTGNLLQDVKNLGEEFMQDSILFIPKGAINNEANAFLLGTNQCENNFLSYEEKLPFDKGKLGYDSPIYTSYVNGRPFIFEDISIEINSPASGMGIWAMKTIANKDWKDL